MLDQPRLVTNVKTHGRASHRRTVWLDDEPWRVMAVEALRECGIAVGDHVDVCELDERLADMEPRLARERALRLLMYRERSAHELHSRLLDDGYPPDVVDSLVAWLVETALVDDARFAEGFARMLVRSRGYGRERAMRELRLRGIDDELARSALDAAAPPEDEAERAHTLARRLMRADDTVDRLAARLARRGFGPGISLDAARSAIADAGLTDTSEQDF